MNIKTSTLITLGLLMTQPVKATCISHDINQSFNLSEKEDQLRSNPSLSLPLEEELEILGQLTKFDLGRYILEKKGLNGFYTSYVILHGPKKQDPSDLEHWLLHKAPLVKATRERFGIFNQQIQKYLTSNMTLASVPCGLMDDLLGQDYSNFSNISLAGIDIDPESLSIASKNALKSCDHPISFAQKDAWNLDVSNQYDILVSNGLNIYESDDLKVTQLYREFYKALKINGVLITSFVTPAPTMTPDSTWRNFNPEDLMKQKAIFSDIVGVSWQKYRTESQTRAQLEHAGFKILDVIYDTQGMFPTIVARK